MCFRDAFYDGINTMMEKIGKNKLQKLTETRGLKQSRFSKVINGKSGNPQLDAIVSFIESFDRDVYLDFVKRIRPDIPIDVICMEGLREVKAYNIVGAKHLEDLTSERVVFTLKIPSEYFPSDFAVMFSGQSMSKVIPDKAAAGVTKNYDFRPGEIYLCELPVEGLTFKRVILFPDHGTLEFRAETAGDVTLIPPHTYSVEEGQNYIVGKLTWVASRK